MIPVPQTIEDWTRLVEDGTPFTYANFGDGEFLAITGRIGVNSDGIRYDPAIGAELAKVLIEPRLTFYGYNPGKRDSEKRLNAERWLREHGINVPVLGQTTLEDPHNGKCDCNIHWVHKEIISYANVRGRFGPFMRALRQRDVVLIAPPAVCWQFADTLRARSHVSVPPDGWIERHRVLGDVRFALDTAPAGAVVSWSFGFPTKVLMWELADERPDLTQIDMGACWDPYVGRLSRSGYKRPEWPEAMARNLLEAGVG
jgi:hypothetical protein